MPKKKKQPKLNATQRQLAADWGKMMAQHAKPLERGAIAKGLEPAKRTRRRQPLLVAPSTVQVDSSRDLRKHPSLDTGMGTAALRDAPKYTGTKMLGIGTMHKSNSVPVFSADDAIDIAKMRRN